MAISDKIFIQYVKISEFEPFANFQILSAKTVPFDFSTDTDSITASLISTTSISNTGIDRSNTSFIFVSGYAPNLTVWFKDSSEAHTFPISSYHWDFGDTFNEGPEDITLESSNYYTVTNVNLLGGDFENPCWSTDKQGLTACHTYILPGTYDVTLSVKASCTSTSDICARYISDDNIGQRFLVYVEEILPQCNGGVFISRISNSGFTNTASSISDKSPLTAYFMASSIIAGSFPINRIDWDFGDGYIQKIVRYPATTITDQGLIVNNISAYASDLNDPRNIVVPHIYNTTYDQTFSITISVYTCNTNTIIICEGTDLISPLSAADSIIVNDTRNLIGSRIDDSGNIIYILEGTNDQNTLHTVALTNMLNITAIP